MKSRISDRGIEAARLMVVTDLDGTLLDFANYLFDVAEPALRKLKRLGVPVICCSSKTSGEIEYWRRRLRLTDPFISENGSAVFLPAARFRMLDGSLVRRGSYLVHELGTPKRLLRSVFEKIRRQSRVEITGFSDMEVRTVQSLCGFKTIQQAKMAVARQYSEPFVFPREADCEAVDRVLLSFEEQGLKIIRGKRFFHLVGDVDKGRAIRVLQETYRKIGEARTVTIGVGDSRNDLEMLESVDFPILVMGKNRRYDQHVKEKVKPMLAGAPGPYGWHRAMEKLLRHLT